ncbi:MAG TPA: HD domain-containing protein [Polyangiaceae bacterium]|nr:HD domain-containing protein [Polyangiaceae bacterium]HPK93336.1 HD domain-containing protein [Polyangiaceae bacterium]
MVESTLPAASSEPRNDDNIVQDRLAHAMERARIGEDRQLAQEVRERGEQLANQLHGLLKTSRMYDADNQAFDRPVSDFRQTLHSLVDILGVVHLVTVEDQVYVNDVRVRFGERTGTPGILGQELRKHNVGGMTFHAPLSEHDTRTLVMAFARPAAGSSPRMALARSLFKNGVKQVELAGIFRYLKSGETRRNVDGSQTDTFERAQRTLEQTWNSALSGRVLNALPLRRIIAEFLEIGPGAEALWDTFEEAPAHIAHAMRVAHASLVLGAAIGLETSALQDLGVGALLHDLGYAAPAQLKESVSRLPHVLGHAVIGARMLATRRGFHEAKVKRVLVALHHHRDLVNRTGSIPPLFGRIVRITEDYDNYTRSDAGGLSPPEAQSILVGGAGSKYDPVLVQAWINAVGRFPPGTLLELEDGRTVRTLSAVRSAETFATPRAFVVGEQGGWVPDYPEFIDLAEVGRPVRVLRTFFPRERVYR